MALWGRIWELFVGQAAGDVAVASARGSSSAGFRDTAGGFPETAGRLGAAPTESGAAPTESDGLRWYAPPDATLGEPVAIERPELTADARLLEDMLVAQFDGHDLSLPPMPRVPEAVLKELRDPECSFAKIADLIGEDQVAAAVVLRTTNSPLYRGREKITDLTLAVSRLGISILQTLMMQQSLRAATFRCGKSGRKLAGDLWRRSLASAYVMRELSGLTGLDPEESLVTGLLHDVGNIIVLRVASDPSTLGVVLPDDRTFEYICQETHQEFGELVADAWNLPPRLKQLIQDHHSYPEPNGPLRADRLSLILTDMIVAMLGYAPPVAYDLPGSRPAADLGLAGRDDFIQLLETLPHRVEQSFNLS